MRTRPIHIGESDFGRHVDAEEFILKAITDLPKLSSIDAQMVMSDLYETNYGIYNHINTGKRRPLASVAIHECEDINDESMLEEAIRTYTEHAIKDTYQLSLTDYLNLPMDIIEMLVHISDGVIQKKGNILSDVEQKLKRGE